MANRIKGITVEIGGDTTKLTESLKAVDKEIANTQKSLRDMNKLLKLDPGNTELLSQKQRSLQKEIAATKERLTALKEAAKQADQALANGDMSQSRSDELGNSGAYLMPQSSVYAVSKAFLKDYSTYDLWIAKNEIFARKGRKFNDPDLQNYFNGKTWYQGTIAPNDFNPDTMLNDAEKANVDLMIELGADTYQK